MNWNPEDYKDFIDSNGHKWKRFELDDLPADRKEYPQIYNFKTPERWVIGTTSPELEQWIKNGRIGPRPIITDKGKQMKIVEFYRGERGNQNDHKLEEILTWTNGQLEMDHDYVQWMFPSNERSMLNGDSPTMTREESEIFCMDLGLQAKVKQSLVRFLEFLDFKLTKDDEAGIVIEPKDDNIPWFIRGPFNHNMLRVTRVLKCLRLTGNNRYAVAFYTALGEFKNNVSQNTWSYWHDAVFTPLWNETSGA